MKSKLKRRRRQRSHRCRRRRRRRQHRRQHPSKLLVEKLNLVFSDRNLKNEKSPEQEKNFW